MNHIMKNCSNVQIENFSLKGLYQWLCSIPVTVYLCFLLTTFATYVMLGKRFARCKVQAACS